MYQSSDPTNKFTRVQCAETRLEPIWACLVSILKDPEHVIPQLEEYTFKSANEDKAREKIRLCDRQIETLENQRTRIVQVFMDGALYEKDYKENLKDCNSRILDYQNQKAKFQQMLAKRDERKDRDEILKKLYTKVKTKLESLDYADKQYIVRLFIERINLFHKDNYAEVFFRFPGSTTVKLEGGTKIVSQPNDLRLVLHVKTLSEKERSREILLSNINRMYRKKGVRIPTSL